MKRSAQIWALLVFLCLPCSIKAQQTSDTGNQVTITIQHADFLERSKTDTANYVMKLLGNVSLMQGSNQLFCDSAYLDMDHNSLEAFGEVHIIQQGGTDVKSDYLRYRGNDKQAFLKGNVSLTDGKNNLWGEEVNYNTATRIATYEQGGTLQSDATTLSSNSGVYNVKTKDARFTGEVYVTDPQYNTQSKDLGYNTETKVVTFLDSSVVTNDKSELRTSRGVYDTKREIAHFISRSSILNIDQYVEGDTMDYNRNTGNGIAVGNVFALDTTQHTTLYCGWAAYNEKTRILKATIKPVLKKANGNDSLYMRADTFYSAPISMMHHNFKMPSPAKDTNIAPVNKGRIRKSKTQIVTDSTDLITRSDTATVDTAGPRYFIAWHHVLIYSDSLQGKCDSLSYNEQDSVMRMMNDPVAWSRNSQITGDTILLYNDSSQLSRLFVPARATVVSRSGPEKAQLFDQVQGSTLTGYFVNNQLNNLVAWPNAESIYFAKDDDDRYLGVSQAESERMRIIFDDQQISKIVFETGVKQTMTPLDKANLPTLRLSRFSWRESERPQDVADLFR